MKLILSNDRYYLINPEELQEGKEYNDIVANFDGKSWHVFKTDRLLHPFKEVLASTKKLEDLPLLNKDIIENKLGIFNSIKKSFEAYPCETEIDEDGNVQYNDEQDLYQREIWEDGYSKAQSDYANKKFTLEDLKAAYLQGAFDSNGIVKALYKEIKAYKSFEEYQEFITRERNEWDIEIEMWTQETVRGFLDASFIGKPRLTPNGYINILKIK